MPLQEELCPVGPGPLDVSSQGVPDDSRCHKTVQGDSALSPFDSWATRYGLFCPHWELVFVLELPRDVPWDGALVT